MIDGEYFILGLNFSGGDDANNSDIVQDII